MSSGQSNVNVPVNAFGNDATKQWSKDALNDPLLSTTGSISGRQESNPITFWSEEETTKSSLPAAADKDEFLHDPNVFESTPYTVISPATQNTLNESRAANPVPPLERQNEVLSTNAEHFSHQKEFPQYNYEAQHMKETQESALTKASVEGVKSIVEQDFGTPSKTEQLSSKATDKAEQLKCDATQKAQQWSAEASDKTSQLKEQAADKTSQLKEQATEQYEQVSEQAQQYKTQAGEQAEQVKQVAQSKFEHVKEVVQEEWQYLKEKAHHLGEQAKQQAHNISSSAKYQAHNLSESAKVQAHKISTKASSVSTQVKQQASAVTQQANQASAKAKQRAMGTVSQLKQSASEAAESARTKSAQLSSQAKKSAKQTASSAKEKASSMKSQSQQGANNLWGSAQNAVNELRQGVKNFVESLNDDNAAYPVMPQARAAARQAPEKAKEVAKEGALKANKLLPQMVEMGVSTYMMAKTAAINYFSSYVEFYETVRMQTTFIQVLTFTMAILQGVLPLLFLDYSEARSVFRSFFYSAIACHGIWFISHAFRLTSFGHALWLPSLISLFFTGAIDDQSHIASARHESFGWLFHPFALRSYFFLLWVRAVLMMSAVNLTLDGLNIWQMMKIRSSNLNAKAQAVGEQITAQGDADEQSDELSGYEEDQDEYEADFENDTTNSSKAGNQSQLRGELQGDIEPLKAPNNTKANQSVPSAEQDIPEDDNLDMDEFDIEDVNDEDLDMSPSPQEVDDAWEGETTVEPQDVEPFLPQVGSNKQSKKTLDAPKAANLLANNKWAKNDKIINSAGISASKVDLNNNPSTATCERSENPEPYTSERATGSLPLRYVCWE